jgi:hypothetical protein
MARRASTIQEWFSLNQEELIHCPYQMGNLKITRSSCRERRRKSGKWVFGSAPDNYVLFAFERHLMVCRQCDQLESEDSVPAQDFHRPPRMDQTPERISG